jgi:hypothetical protein
MELLHKEIGERPTAERAIRSLGEAVGLSRSTIFRHLHAPSSSSSLNNDVELRGQIQSIALEMRSYGYRPITKIGSGGRDRTADLGVMKTREMPAPNSYRA